MGDEEGTVPDTPSEPRPDAGSSGSGGAGGSGGSGRRSRFGPHGPARAGGSPDDAAGAPQRSRFGPHGPAASGSGAGDGSGGPAASGSPTRPVGPDGEPPLFVPQPYKPPTPEPPPPQPVYGQPMPGPPPGYGPPREAYGYPVGPPQPVYGGGAPVVAPPAEEDEPTWWERLRGGKRNKRKRGRRRWLVWAVIVAVLYLWYRSCHGDPTVLDLRPAPTDTGAITSVPAGPVIHTSGPTPGDVPAEDLAAHARKAAQDARAYHLKGTADLSPGGVVTVDLRLGDTTTGTITANGSTIEVRRSGLDIASRAPGAATWTPGDTAHLPNGDTLSLLPLTDAGHWITELIPTPESATAAANPEPLDGRQVRRIRLRGGQYLYVAATGTPYPVKLTNPDGQYPNLSFDGWR